MAFTRRDFLRAAAATASLGAAGRARAAPSPSQRKFLFVFNDGGYDQTTTWVPCWELDNNPLIEEGAELSTGSTHDWVSHPDRPSVDAFYNTYEHRLVRVDGVQVRSVAHDICMRLTLTGTTDPLQPDVATVLADGDPTSRYLPHLVVGGPSFSGTLADNIARVGPNGQLQALADGSIHGWIDQKQPDIVGTEARSIVDRYLLDRAEQRLGLARSQTERDMVRAWSTSLERSIDLRQSASLPVEPAEYFAEQVELAVEMLSVGYSRTASLMWPTKKEAALNYDTHRDNSWQSTLFEGLFEQLIGLMELLADTPGEVANTLAEEVVVVVWSEFGRTPFANDAGGKDHWPYSTTLLILPEDSYDGPPVLGGYDSSLFPLDTELSSGLPSTTGGTLDSSNLCATLMAMGDVDPGDFLPNAEPLGPLVD